ncbi:MAG: sugar phosphate isomerase/epimerase [Pedosphaera sp.]|nr:sugar phosphate isomerase/epimerase [Pedosphaera sp.]
MNNLSRRDLLNRTGLAAAGLVLAPVARAIEPFKRPGQPTLRLSLAAYSFRQFFKDGQRTEKGAAPARAIDLFQFLDFCADHGCEGAELTSYFFPKETDGAFLRRLRRHAFLRGLVISGTAVGNNFTHPKGDARDREIALVKLWTDHAAALGTAHVRVFAGQSKTLPKVDAEKNVIAALEECCDYAGKKGVFLGLENHDSIGTAENLIRLIKMVQSPWLGVNLDSGNFRTADPYVDFEQALPYAVNIQIKTEIRRANAPKSEPADLPRLVKLMRAANYQGFVALEYESAEDPFTAIPPTLQQLKKLFAV